MTAGSAPQGEPWFETSRLLLRPWRVAEAAVLRELWTERDPRVPPHRRIDADGHPTLAELEDSIRTNPPSSTGVLAIERKVAGDVIGYCGPSTAHQRQGESRNWRLSCSAGSGVTATRQRPPGRCWTGRDRPDTNACGPRSGIGTRLLFASWPRSGSRRLTRGKRPTGPTWSRPDGSNRPDPPSRRGPNIRAPGKYPDRLATAHSRPVVSMLGRGLWCVGRRARRSMRPAAAASRPVGLDVGPASVRSATAGRGLPRWLLTWSAAVQ